MEDDPTRSRALAQEPRKGGGEPRRHGDRAASETIEFEPFVDRHRRAMRQAFVGRYGVEVGIEVTAEVFAHAWERWPEVRVVSNPRGYLYRVGQSRARRLLRWRRDSRFPAPTVSEAMPRVEEHIVLLTALRRLSDQQRVAVLLVHAYGWSYAEVSEVMEVPQTTVKNYVFRGMSNLRARLEDPHDGS